MVNVEQKIRPAKKFLGRAKLAICWLFAALLIPVQGYAASSGQYGVLVSWDRSSSTAVNSYRIYYGPSSRNYTNVLTVGDVTTNTVLGLEPGVAYYFAITAATTNGLESAFSDEIRFVPGMPEVQLHLGTDNQLMLTLSGLINHAYEIQATEDFQTWTAIDTVTLDENGSLNFTDTNAANFSQRFYRTREIP